MNNNRLGDIENHTISILEELYAKIDRMKEAELKKYPMENPGIYIILSEKSGEYIGKKMNILNSIEKESLELNEQNAYLLNLMILLIQHAPEPYFGYMDWHIIKKASKSININTKGYHSLDSLRINDDIYGKFYDEESSCKKFISLTTRDLKSGNINDAIKRTLCFLAWHKSMINVYQGQIYINNSHTFDNTLFRQLNSIFSQLILWIGDNKYTEFFYRMAPKQFPSEAMIQMIQTNLNSRNLASAKTYLKDFRRRDKHNPSLKVLEAEYNRLIKISQLKDSAGIDLENVNDLTGKEFEELLILKFVKLGYKALSTPATGDYGADIILETKNNTIIVVQCKRYKNKVNLKAVQEVVGAMAHYGGDYGIVITNNGFLNSAKKLAESSDVELWGGGQLADFMLGDLSFSKIKDL